jgi:hypothetical protein
VSHNDFNYIFRDEEDVEDCSLTVEEKESVIASKNNSFARREQVISPPVIVALF